jgi:NAD(P)-dependent dehydrogenase (short-subunit alcohol dehydrogenase family)
MKILVIGGNGTLGKQICRELAQEDEIITAGRNSGDYRVNITSPGSIRQLFEQINGLDACICVAASGALDNFQTLTEDELLRNMKGKFFGQANLVLIGQHYLNKGGSFTLTSGVFADHPDKSVTGGGVVSGALHSFVLSAALERSFPRKLYQPRNGRRFCKRFRAPVPGFETRLDGTFEGSLSPMRVWKRYR